MSREGISASSLSGQNEFEFCEKSFAHQKDLLMHQCTIHREKTLKCHLCLYESERNDKLVSHQKMHTKGSSEQALNGSHTKLKPIYHIRKSQEPHQEPVLSPKHPQLENIKIKSVSLPTALTK